MRTSKADKNYLSLNSQSVVWFAGTPEEREETAPLPQPLTLTPENPTAWDSILKLSGRQKTQMAGLAIGQGMENALDVNSSSAFIDLEGDWGVDVGYGDQVFTIKGGSHDIKLSGIVFSSGKKAVCTLGCWSDQSTEPVYNIDLSQLVMISGQPFTVIFGRVKNPLAALFGRSDHIKLPLGAKILFWRSIGEILYWWGKRAAVKLGLFR